MWVNSKYEWRHWLDGLQWDTLTGHIIADDGMPSFEYGAKRLRAEDVSEVPAVEPSEGVVEREDLIAEGGGEAEDG